MMFMYQQSKPHFSGLLQLSKPKLKLSVYRPNDWVHMHYAVQAYKESGGKEIGKP